MIDKLVAEFGEQHRRMIVSALDFLDEKEPTWGLETPIDRRAYIRDLVAKVAKSTGFHERERQ
jgi:hypothetical protein